MRILDYGGGLARCETLYDTTRCVGQASWESSNNRSGTGQPPRFDAPVEIRCSSDAEDAENVVQAVIYGVKRPVLDHWSELPCKRTVPFPMPQDANMAPFALSCLLGKCAKMALLGYLRGNVLCCNVLFQCKLCDIKFERDR